MKDYVQKLENGAYRLTGTRVSLDSVVYSYNAGDLPELITRQFPSLKLEQVYGAIAFYLSNSEEIDKYLRLQEAEHERWRQEQRQADPEFYARFDKLREETKRETLTR
jgi:uncharacterized protein (DUF433 family)